ncbi:MAG: preprotein translocase subunit SecY [candidate division WS6 bacterium 34_10]|uniref:Protein translocase subunit SecY n=1 Tax=candidate division WS6 bacterium 34_10 TaxID=1641389 RepID=A0A101HHP9_9BACT|nr:MAG: preprotein translocase subunit SecY [candidate division WS6 bacterium 34_10]
MATFLEKIQAFWKTKDIRSKILFSIGILVIYRLLAAIPVVGIPADAISQLFAGSELGDLLSTVSGGVLETASVVAIGLTPYINASIVFQLLGSVIPKLEEMRKEGVEGRRKISMYTRLLTVPLAILQSFVIYSTLRGFGLVDQLDTLTLIAMSATLTGGSIIMMWLSELISEDGLGGGSSYLIFLGIIAGIPGTVRNNLRLMDGLQTTIFVVFTIILVASVVYITQAERRITTQYSRRVRAGGAKDSYIPIKLTQTGVMPVIFAISILSFPQLIAQFLISKEYSEQITNISQSVLDFLSNDVYKNVLTFVLIIAFSFFYLTVVFNTEELAENLQKQGAFIPGIRPGKSTSDYLRKVAFRLTAVGSLFLALIAVLPNILISTGLLTTTIMSGTGLLIVVNTVLEIKREVESMSVIRSYDKYL